MIIKQILSVSVVGNVEKNVHTDSTVTNKPSHPLVLDLFPVSKPRGESKTVTLLPYNSQIQFVILLTVNNTIPMMLVQRV